MYQTVVHDEWDYDNISQPFAVDFTKDGKEVHATFETHKDGFTYVVDRDPKHFGHYGGKDWENVPAIYVKPFMDGITWTKGNLDEKMHPLYDPAKDSTTPNLVDVCPSFLGGTNYLVPSYDASTKTAFISGNYWCETIKGTPVQPWAPYKAYVYAEFHMHVMPGHEGGGGFIKAIDVTNGKTKWEHDMTDANWSGLVAMLVAFCSAAAPTPVTSSLWTWRPVSGSGSSVPTQAWSARRSRMRSTESSMLLSSLASAVRFLSGPAKSGINSTRIPRKVVRFGSSPSRVPSSS